MQQLPFTREPQSDRFSVPGVGILTLGRYARADSQRVFYSAAEIISAVNPSANAAVPAFLRSGNCKDAIEYLEQSPLTDRRLSVPADKMGKYAAQDPFGRYFFCAEMSSALILYLQARIGLHLLAAPLPPEAAPSNSTLTNN